MNSDHRSKRFGLTHHFPNVGKMVKRIQLKVQLTAPETEMAKYLEELGYGA